MTSATSASAFAAAGSCSAWVRARGLRVKCVRIYPKGRDGRGAAATAAADAAAASSSAAADDDDDADADDDAASAAIQ